MSLVCTLACVTATTLLASVPASAVASGASFDWHWARASAATSSVGVDAIAVESERGRVALGHARGVELADAVEPDAAATRFYRGARVPPVLDLHFDAQRVLWIATLDGLWCLHPDGRLRDRSPAPGEAARRVRRVRTARGVVVAATDAGLFVSWDGERWRAADGALPSAPVTALEITPGQGSETIVWLVAGSDTWRVELRDASSPFVAQRIPRAPGLPAGVGPIDVVTDVPGHDLVLLFPTLLAWRDASAGGAQRWQVARPAWPPGSQALRLLFAAGRLWLATDRGLLCAARLDGPWMRCLEGASGQRVRAMAAGPGVRLWAATERGLHVGAPRPGERALASDAVVQGAGAPEHPPRARREPGIREVQLAVLRYVDLRPSVVRSMERRLARRAWLPQLKLAGRYGDDRDVDRDADQSFVSGATRHLVDVRRLYQRDWEVSAALSWDLPLLVFDEGAIDISREARQRISLRDDVLDEVNQLYFERVALLLRIAGAPDPDDPEVVRARLRAAELAAGLDAWTGGWFGARIAPDTPDPALDTPDTKGELP